MQGTDSQARDDWRSEVNQMGRVYSSAHITISAAAARDSDGGLFSRGRCLLPCLGKYGVVAVYWLTRERNLGGEPIYKRAWTLQEHLLSPRILMYAGLGLVWQCDKETIGNMDNQARPYNTVLRYRLPSLPGIPDWDRLVENYCSRELTIPSDKFPGIAALARQYHQATSDQYLAGLWRSTILADLLWHHEPTWFWYPTPNYHRSDNYRAPSWSWASMDGNVLSRANRGGGANWHARFIDCQVALGDPENPFGEVTSARLRISGPVIEGLWVRIGDQRESPTYVYDDGSYTRCISMLLLDNPTRETPGRIGRARPLVCLVVGGKPQQQYALALLPVHGTRDTYARVGVIRINHEVAEDGFPERLVRSVWFI